MTSDATAQLRSGEWIITDLDGNSEGGVGDGVVGEQPVLDPGDSYEYTRCCALPTLVGSMHGHYVMQLRNGESVDAVIDPFTLAVPGSVD